MPPQYDLERFVEAQDPVYDQVRQELASGQKRTHWMWFIFPQGPRDNSSPNSQLYAISSVDEAQDYYDHPVLGPRLKECTQLVNQAPGSLQDIFGTVDTMKFKSCMELFYQATGDPLFKSVKTSGWLRTAKTVEELAHEQFEDILGYRGMKGGHKPARADIQKMQELKALAEDSLDFGADYDASRARKWADLAGLNEKEIGILVDFQHLVNRTDFDRAFDGMVKFLATGEAPSPDVRPQNVFHGDEMKARQFLGSIIRRYETQQTPVLLNTIERSLQDICRTDAQSYKLWPWMVNQIKKEWKNWLYVDGNYWGGANSTYNPGNLNRKLDASHIVDLTREGGGILAELRRQNKLPQGLDVNQMSLKELEEWLMEWKRENRESEDQGEVVFEYPDGWTMQRLTTPEQLQYEGDEMGHCVGGYANDVEDGSSYIYSLRDRKGVPHVTIEVQGAQAYELLSEKPIADWTEEDASIMGEAMGKLPHTCTMPILESDEDEEYFKQLQFEGKDDLIKRFFPMYAAKPTKKFGPHDRPDGKIFTYPGRPYGKTFAVVQIQGQGNTTPKPEYAARVKTFFNSLEEEKGITFERHEDWYENDYYDNPWDNMSGVLIEDAESLAGWNDDYYQDLWEHYHGLGKDEYGLNNSPRSLNNMELGDVMNDCVRALVDDSHDTWNTSDWEGMALHTYRAALLGGYEHSMFLNILNHAEYKLDGWEQAHAENNDDTASWSENARRYLEYLERLATYEPWPSDVRDMPRPGQIPKPAELEERHNEATGQTRMDIANLDNPGQNLSLPGALSSWGGLPEFSPGDRVIHPNTNPFAPLVVVGPAQGAAGSKLDGVNEFVILEAEDGHRRLVRPVNELRFADDPEQLKLAGWGDKVEPDEDQMLIADDYQVLPNPNSRDERSYIVADPVGNPLGEMRMDLYRTSWRHNRSWNEDEEPILPEEVDEVTVEELNVRDPTAVEFLTRFFTTINTNGNTAIWDKQMVWEWSSYEYGVADWRDSENIEDVDGLIRVHENLGEFSYDNWSYDWDDSDIEYTMSDDVDEFGLRYYTAEIKEPMPPRINFGTGEWSAIFYEEIEAISDGYPHSDSYEVAKALIDVPQFILNESSQQYDIPGYGDNPSAGTPSYQEWQFGGGMAYIDSAVRDAQSRYADNVGVMEWLSLFDGGHHPIPGQISIFDPGQGIEGTLSRVIKKVSGWLKDEPRSVVPEQQKLTPQQWTDRYGRQFSVGDKVWWFVKMRRYGDTTYPEVRPTTITGISVGTVSASIWVTTGSRPPTKLVSPEHLGTNPNNIPALHWRESAWAQAEHQFKVGDRVLHKLNRDWMSGTVRRINHMQYQREPMIEVEWDHNAPNANNPNRSSWVASDLIPMDNQQLGLVADVMKLHSNVIEGTIPGWEDVDENLFTWRRPFYYDDKNDTIILGQQGTHHSELDQEFGDEMPFGDRNESVAMKEFGGPELTRGALCPTPKGDFFVEIFYVPEDVSDTGLKEHIVEKLRGEGYSVRDPQTDFDDFNDLLYDSFSQWQAKTAGGWETNQYEPKHGDVIRHPTKPGFFGIVVNPYTGWDMPGKWRAYVTWINPSLAEQGRPYDEVTYRETDIDITDMELVDRKNEGQTHLFYAGWDTDYKPGDLVYWQDGQYRHEAIIMSGPYNRKMPWDLDAVDGYEIAIPGEGDLLLRKGGDPQNIDDWEWYGENNGFYVRMDELTPREATSELPLGHFGGWVQGDEPNMAQERAIRSFMRQAEDVDIIERYPDGSIGVLVMMPITEDTDNTDDYIVTISPDGKYTVGLSGMDPTGLSEDRQMHLASGWVQGPVDNSQYEMDTEIEYEDGPEFYVSSYDELIEWWEEWNKNPKMFDQNQGRDYQPGGPYHNPQLMTMVQVGPATITIDWEGILDYTIQKIEKGRDRRYWGGGFDGNEFSQAVDILYAVQQQLSQTPGSNVPAPPAWESLKDIVGEQVGEKWNEMTDMNWEYLADGVFEWWKHFVWDEQRRKLEDEYEDDELPDMDEWDYYEQWREDNEDEYYKIYGEQERELWRETMGDYDYLLSAFDINWWAKTARTGSQGLEVGDEVAINPDHPESWLYDKSITGTVLSLAAKNSVVIYWDTQRNPYIMKCDLLIKVRHV